MPDVDKGINANPARVNPTHHRHRYGRIEQSVPSSVSNFISNKHRLGTVQYDSGSNQYFDSMTTTKVCLACGTLNGHNYTTGILLYAKYRSPLYNVLQE